MRYLIGTSILIAVLASCAPTAPNDGETYFDKITPDPAALERKAEENRLIRAETETVVIDLRADTVTGATAEAAASGDTTVTVDLTSGTPVQTNTAAKTSGEISNSQDFQVVKANETIASDAAKLEALKSTYEIVQPGAAPRRGSDLNLAKYALSQSNPVGKKIYTRFPLGGKRAKRKCAAYGSNEEAQTEFLKSGGPQKDRRGIDPDGDGYACDWSPEAYRALIGQ